MQSHCNKSLSESDFQHPRSVILSSLRPASRAEVAAPLRQECPEYFRAQTRAEAEGAEMKLRTNTAHETAQPLISPVCRFIAGLMGAGGAPSSTNPQLRWQQEELQLRWWYESS